MRKSAAILAVSVSILASGAVASAQSSGVDKTATTADRAAVAAVKRAGKTKLLATKKVKFSFKVGILDTKHVCPPGQTDPTYCKDEPVGGAYRFIMKFEDPRPGKHRASAVVATNIKRSIDSNSTVNVVAGIRDSGQAMLRYAIAANKQITVQLITHVRPGTTGQTTEVFTFLLS